MSAPTILQLLASQSEQAGPCPIPEAIVARLREAGEIYRSFLAGDSSYDVGDLVTPRRDAPLGGAGRPHLVVESRPGAEPHPKHGLRLDLRVLMLHEQDNETVASVWVESWWMEPWTEAHAAMSRPAEGSA